MSAVVASMAQDFKDYIIHPYVRFITHDSLMCTTIFSLLLLYFILLVLSTTQGLRIQVRCFLPIL